MGVKQTANKMAYRIFNIFISRLMQYVISGKILFPFYHTVSDEYLPYIINLYQYRNVKDFNSDIDFFLKDRIPLDLDSLIEILDG